MKFFKLSLASLSVFALPFLVSAVDRGDEGRIFALLGLVGEVISRIIPIIVGLALVVFLWGILLYVISKGTDDKEKARGFMIWGIIGLFVMTAVWGIVNILSSAVFGTGPIDRPTVLPGFEVRPGAAGGSRPLDDRFVV